MNQNICMNCRWWTAVNPRDIQIHIKECQEEGHEPRPSISRDTDGQCRYNAPVKTSHNDPYSSYVAFPKTQFLDWCRMFEHKDSKG